MKVEQYDLRENT